MNLSRWRRFSGSWGLCLIAAAACVSRGAWAVARAPGFLLLNPDVLTENSATAVSADGSTVIGWISGFPDYPGFTACRWTDAGGRTDLGHLLTGSDLGTVPESVSGDGSVIVGRSSNQLWIDHAFRWTEADGTQPLEEFSAGQQMSGALGVSRDGSAIVGWSAVVQDGSDTSEAVRWTAEGQAFGIGDISGGAFASYATATNMDGSVIVGTGASDASSSEPFRWTAATGAIGLGDLPGGPFESIAQAVSDN